MIRKLLFPFVVTGLLFAPAGRPQESTPPPAKNSNSSATWKVTCHGISSVPMTADAEQALPLKIVANLKCGEEVVLLSGAEGYTVNVRTADGKTGYVAAMYLKRVPPPRRTFDSSNLKNGVARWAEGAPGCNHFMTTDGSLLESVTVDGVTVQVSLYDTGWKFRAQVAVANDSPGPIAVDPSKFILDEIGPHGKPLFYNDPVRLAKNMTHQVLWSEANAAPATLQARAESATSTGSGTLTLSYRTSLGSSFSAPNYLVQHQAAERDAIRAQGRQTLIDYAKQVQTLALKPGMVAPTETLSGAVWFDRSKNPQQLILRIPIENNSFEFPLSFKQKK